MQESDGKDTSASCFFYDEANYIIDGKTYYRDVLQEYYVYAMQLVSEEYIKSPILLSVIEMYFMIIM